MITLKNQPDTYTHTNKYIRLLRSLDFGEGFGVLGGFPKGLTLSLVGLGVSHDRLLALGLSFKFENIFGTLA